MAPAIPYMAALPSGAGVPCVSDAAQARRSLRNGSTTRVCAGLVAHAVRQKQSLVKARADLLSGTVGRRDAAVERTGMYSQRVPISRFAADRSYANSTLILHKLSFKNA